MAWQDRDYNREDTSSGVSRSGGGYGWSMPPIGQLAVVLMAVCVGMFIATGPAQAGVARRYGALTLMDGLAWRQPWRWIVYQYLHANGAHLLFNLVGMYCFVPMVERAWGWKRTLGFYTLGGIAAGAAYIVMVAITGRASDIVGASGSLMACMGAAAMVYPRAMVFGVLPIRVAVGLYGAFYLLSSLLGHDLADACHLGGLVFGLLASPGTPWFRKLGIKYEAWQAAREFEQEQQEQGEIDRILAKVHAQG
ncbi:MAG: rhomboid family intramembrane serine protease, partial [Tepidisphaerales bacterium]